MIQVALGESEFTVTDVLPSSWTDILGLDPETKNSEITSLERLDDTYAFIYGEYTSESGG